MIEKQGNWIPFEHKSRDVEEATISRRLKRLEMIVKQGNWIPYKHKSRDVE